MFMVTKCRMMHKWINTNWKIASSSKMNSNSIFHSYPDGTQFKFIDDEMPLLKVWYICRSCQFRSIKIGPECYDGKICSKCGHVAVVVMVVSKQYIFGDPNSLENLCLNRIRSDFLMASQNQDEFPLPWIPKSENKLYFFFSKDKIMFIYRAFHSTIIIII